MECVTKGLSVSLLLLLSASHVTAQTGQIRGTVKEKSSGVALPGVVITVTSTDTGVARSTLTNEAGAYTIPDLPIGLSKVEATLPDFQPYSRTTFVLEAPSGSVIDVTMKVAPLRVVVPLPHMVCGLQIVSGDASADTRMAKPLPDTSVTQSMQVEPPIVCADSSSQPPSRR
jgi:hypothetical protein